MLSPGGGLSLFLEHTFNHYSTVIPTDLFWHFSTFLAFTETFFSICSGSKLPDWVVSTLKGHDKALRFFTVGSNCSECRMLLKRKDLKSYRANRGLAYAVRTIISPMKWTTQTHASKTAQFNVRNLVRPFMCFMDRDTAYIHEHEKKQRTVTQGLWLQDCDSRTLTSGLWLKEGPWLMDSDSRTLIQELWLKEPD